VSARFRRHGDGVIVSLATAEVELLRSVPAELQTVLAGSSAENDPVYNRLFPSAYLDPTEENAEQEWQELVHPELLRERLAALELVATTLDRAVTKRGRAELELTSNEVHAWMGVLNDARLALGTRLGITEEPEAEEFDASAPDAAAHDLYAWLTWLQNDLIETLLGE